MVWIHRILDAAVAWRRMLGACGFSALVHGAGLVGLGMLLIQAGHHPSGSAELDAEFTQPARFDTPVVMAAAQVSPQVVRASYSAYSYSPTLGTGGGLGGGVGGGLPAGIGLRVPADGGGNQATQLVGLVDVSLVEVGKGPLGNRSASFFGITASGEDFVFVVDVSGSMSEGGRFRRAKVELTRSLHELSSSQKFFIVFFSDDAWSMPAEGLQLATPQNIRNALRWVNNVQPGGHTYPLSSLLVALKLDPDAIYLLSDGQFDPEVLEYVAQQAGSDPVPIHTIAFISRIGEPVMKAISRITHGTYRFVH